MENATKYAGPEAILSNLTGQQCTKLGGSGEGQLLFDISEGAMSSSIAPGSGFQVRIQGIKVESSSLGL